MSVTTQELKTRPSFGWLKDVTSGRSWEGKNMKAASGFIFWVIVVHPPELTWLNGNNNHAWKCAIYISYKNGDFPPSHVNFAGCISDQELGDFPAIPTSVLLGGKILGSSRDSFALRKNEYMTTLSDLLHQSHLSPLVPSSCRCQKDYHPNQAPSTLQSNHSVMEAIRLQLVHLAWAPKLYHSTADVWFQQMQTLEPKWNMAYSPDNVHHPERPVE